MGYHTREIERGTYGEFSKVREEFEELIDAHEQDNPIMELVELSDLLLAIHGYVSERFNLTIDDVLTMARATESAFEDGTRVARPDVPPPPPTPTVPVEGIDPDFMVPVEHFPTTVPDYKRTQDPKWADNRKVIF